MLGLDLPANLEPADVRELDVEKNEMWRVRPHHPQGLLAKRRLRNGVAAASQRMRLQVTAGLIVVDDEYPFRTDGGHREAAPRAPMAFRMAPTSASPVSSDFGTMHEAVLNRRRFSSLMLIDVTMIAGVRLVPLLARIWSRNSNPSITGMSRSTRTISGAWSRSLRKASWPVAASLSSNPVSAPGF